MFPDEQAFTSLQLIANTTTRTSLTVQCRLDKNAYDKGVKIFDGEMATLNITFADFHGEWSCTISLRHHEN